MTPELETTRLFKWLKKKDALLASRVGMVRRELAKCLPQILQFFPHYPSHGVGHSDRIVAQLSNLLFSGSNPVVAFSAGEVYCLLCAAYVHDIGMVVSPAEAENLLCSDAWKQFIAEGGNAHDAFRQYEALRAAPVQGNKERIAFLADMALRQVFADFVRREHHERGKTTLEMHPFLKQLVDDGDSVAFETIADLGLGHGVSDSDLADPTRYPEERDVLGDKVNVRFLARLVRIGDLLDLDSRRADPMTARAAAPLPRDAVPHWQQYSAKKHENITPAVIEFRFECRDQETHRILRDWFGWLESEVRGVGLEQLHAARHDKWKAPRCIVSSRSTPEERDEKANPTIIIKPARGANYAFHDWRLELDHEQVLDLLIYDVYEHPSVFVRELIQNALDATRCQMYADFALQNPGVASPERPTQFPPAFRERYPVVLSLTDEEVNLSPDAPPEKRRVFTIEDRGTGMDEQIITRYFLQVGRSYYQSSEFRERFKFVPSSRFGVGFLSVFAVSKNITVETARRQDATGKVKGLRLNLREPRKYLLTESWKPFPHRVAGPENGTRIRVVLDVWSDRVSLVDLVRRWCVAVEVPVIVQEAGQETLIRPERLKERTILATSKVDPNGRFILRVFDLNTHAVEGQIAVMAYVDEKGEGWCDCWPQDKGLDGAREDDLPKCGEDFTALHGIAVGGTLVSVRSWRRQEQWLQRADIRSAVRGIAVGRSMFMRRHVAFGIPLARNVEDRGAPISAVQAVQNAAQGAVEEHLAESTRAKGERGAAYRAQVLSGAPVPDDWRDHYPGTVVTWRNGRREDICVAELLALEGLVFAAWGLPDYWLGQPPPPMKRHPRDVNSSLPVVSWSDTPVFSEDRFGEKIRAMNLCGVRTDEDLWLFTFSSTRTVQGFDRACPGHPSWIAPLSLGNLSGVRLEHLERMAGYFSILDRDDPVVQWLSAIRVAAMKQPDMIDSATVEACWLTAVDRTYQMDDLIRRWADDPRVPEALKPPRDSRGGQAQIKVLELSGRSTLGGKS